MTERPLILLCNDDGYRAKGLRTLGVALRRIADVVVCAPEAEQSAKSHSLTLHRPLRLRRVDEGVFALDGTPADCVYVALYSEGRVLPRRPDLVVSGLNHGLNLGADVFYSGTVAAAREGALRGVPALAASADTEADPVEAAELIARMATTLLEAHPEANGSTQAPLLNVNIPRGRSWPLVATTLGSRLYGEFVEFRNDPRGREYLWIGGGQIKHPEMAGSDTAACDRGAVSITPLLLDLTAHARAPWAERIATSLASPHTETP